MDRPFRNLSTRALKRAYRKAFKQWEQCVERYYRSLALDHLDAMKLMAKELDARKPAS